MRSACGSDVIGLGKTDRGELAAENADEDDDEDGDALEVEEEKEQDSF